MNLKSSHFPQANVSLRQGRKSADYRGITVSVPSMGLRLRVHGADRRADMIRVVALCDSAGWTPEFTAATKRAFPELRIIELLQADAASGADDV